MVVNSGVGREGERKHYDAVEREAIWMPKGKTGSAETDCLVRDDSVLRSSTPPIGGGHILLLFIIVVPDILIDRHDLDSLSLSIHSRKIGYIGLDNKLSPLATSTIDCLGREIWPT